ncbi:MAG: hypothetical protein RJA49_1707 [Actinomycetota bacterium]
MHLFSRTIHMSGPYPDIVAQNIAMCAYVNSKAPAPVTLWDVGFGAPLGTFVFSTRAEGLSGVMALGALFDGDAEYLALEAKGAAWIDGPVVDQLREAISEPAAGELPGPGAVVTVTTATIANGRYADAIGWGLQVAEHVTNVSGLPVTLWNTMTGTFGELAWIGVAPDGAAFDDSNAKLNVDPGYMEMLGAAGELFVPGSAHRQVGFRLA